MSLTSYRAAPPRGIGGSLGVVFRNAFRVGFWLPFGRPGGDLLSHVLGRSTIGAEGFHGRVRDGIGCMAPRHDHQVVGTEAGERVRLVFCVEVLLFAAGGLWSLHATEGSNQAERAISTG